MATQNIITQVTQDRTAPVHYDESNGTNMIYLKVREVPFTVTRDELMSLPESLLLCLFPNGVFLDEHGDIITNLTENDTVFVNNYSAESFQYILDTYRAADLELKTITPQRSQTNLFGFHHPQTDAEIIQDKPSIIVLREDLDFYVIPPCAGVDADLMKEIKIAAGSYLTQARGVFSGLGSKKGAAEQHLMDMLCSSGFEHTSTWDQRTFEPAKTVVSSLSLVRLNTFGSESKSRSESRGASMTRSGSQEQTDLNQLGAAIESNKRKSRLSTLASNVRSVSSRSASRSRSRKKPEQTTKLLLFWKKPARKCWWSDDEIELELPGFKFEGENLVADKNATEPVPVKIKIHIRRVWTLELSVVGV